jgi:hypothetical protein
MNTSMFFLDYLLPRITASPIHLQAENPTPACNAAVLKMKKKFSAQRKMRKTTFSISFRSRSMNAQ